MNAKDYDHAVALQRFQQQQEPFDMGANRVSASTLQNTLEKQYRGFQELAAQVAAVHGEVEKLRERYLYMINEETTLSAVGSVASRSVLGTHHVADPFQDADKDEEQAKLNLDKVLLMQKRRRGGANAIGGAARGMTGGQLGLPAAGGLGMATGLGAGLGATTGLAPMGGLGQPAFGAKPAGANASAPAGGLLGAPTVGGGLFGAPANKPAGGGIFGAPANNPAGGGLFGAAANKPAGGGLFAGASAPALGGGGGFGASFGGAPANQLAPKKKKKNR